MNFNINYPYFYFVFVISVFVIDIITPIIKFKRNNKLITVMFSEFLKQILALHNSTKFSRKFNNRF